MAGQGVFIAQDRLLVDHRPLLSEEGLPVIDIDGHPQIEEVYRERGEIVPEAQEWTDVDSWIRAGKIALVPEAVVQLQQRVAALEAQMEELLTAPAKTTRRGGPNG